MYYTYARNTQVSLYQHTLHNSVNYISYSKIVGISQRRCCRTVQRDHQRRGITEPESSTQSAVITTSLLYEICNLRGNSCSPDSYVDYMYNVLIHFFLSAEAIVILPLSDLIPPLPLDYYFSPKISLLMWPSSPSLSTEALITVEACPLIPLSVLRVHSQHQHPEKGAQNPPFP